MSPRVLMILTENWTLVPDRDVGGLVEMARVAEQAGVDGVMVSEHVVLGGSADAGGLPENPRAYAMPGNQDPRSAWPSSLVLLSAMAAVTTRLRLVAGAVISPLRHPLALAKDLGTLDLLSGGRLVVLPSVSWHEQEYAALGVPFRARGRILDEQLVVWERVWARSPAMFSGEHFSFHDVYVEPKAFRPGGPTLWFGGATAHPALLRRIARYGSGFNPLGQPSSQDLQRIQDALVAAGRDPGELELVGGTRAVFEDAGGVADLEHALRTIPEQADQGFTTYCVKPGQFIQSMDEYPDFCRHVVKRIDELAS
jgi:probable F420-dependent oxidoreductase